MNSLNTHEDLHRDEDLLKRIRNKRRSIKSFLSTLEPKSIRLTNLNVVCGAIATGLTTIAAIWGKTATNSGDSPVWRIVLVVAAVFSFSSFLAADLYRRNEMASRLGKAQACDAKLEGLETLLGLDQITLKDAATAYTQYISEIPFISDESVPSLDWVKGDILEPKPNQVVENTFHCSISVEDFGAGCHLWLAVEIGGRIWPKEHELHLEEDSTWKGKISEEGTVDAFSLSLYAANRKANQQIRAWLDRGDAAGKYKELRRISGTRRIARVDGLHRKKAS